MKHNGYNLPPFVRIRTTTFGQIAVSPHAKVKSAAQEAAAPQVCQVNVASSFFFALFLSSRCAQLITSMSSALEVVPTARPPHRV